ncbi:unnamed protein product [Symbiodinium natans]|uniref:Uncharacterized protein n=1 Tax=Symbiodinium natans TaxID=878477 RepID=A0A812I5H3_9DINO|nr:unnamed protein product [Symbiodinium natans]
MPGMRRAENTGASEPVAGSPRAAPVAPAAPAAQARRADETAGPGYCSYGRIRKPLDARTEAGAAALAARPSVNAKVAHHPAIWTARMACVSTLSKGLYNKHLLRALA